MKYILIQVVDREIWGTQYDTYEEAYKAMTEAYNEVQRGDNREIGEWDAYINDGTNHCDFDWKILEI